MDDGHERPTDPPCSPNCPALQWIEIPGGTFMMGSPERVGDSEEHPRHEVTVQGFRMLKTEVTVSQYEACVDAGACGEPYVGGGWYNWGTPGREDYPVNGLDWYQARTFSEWVGGRLPTEAEWEYAARSGGRDIAYPWGDEEASCEFAVIYEVGGNGCRTGMTMEVCSKPLGNTIQGLCDMAGNVPEWVEDDWHNGYNGAPSDGQAWVDDPRVDFRIVRGGSWVSNPRDCRCACRSLYDPDLRVNEFGFRVVLES